MSSSKKTAPVVDLTSDPNQPPWPEWSDAFINTMQWNIKPTKLSSHSSKNIKENSIPNTIQVCLSFII